MFRTSFIRAVVSELTWGKVIAMHGLLLVWLVYRFFPDVPPLAALVVNELMAINLLLAILVARETVNRGIHPMISFPAALVCAAILSGVLQWYVRRLFHLDLLQDDLDPSSLQRKYGHMIVIALDTILYGTCVMLVYVSRLRELACVQLARDAELRRTQMGRELTRSKLAATRMRLDPEQIIDELRHLRYLYQRGAPDAERQLDKLVAELRTRTRNALAAPTGSAEATP
jgi:hypothetical protein